MITYNFTDNPERLKITKEQVLKAEKEIEAADNSAVPSRKGSYKLCHTAPKKSRETHWFFPVFLYNSGVFCKFLRASRTPLLHVFPPRRLFEKTFFRIYRISDLASRKTGTLGKVPALCVWRGKKCAYESQAYSRMFVVI